VFYIFKNQHNTLIKIKQMTEHTLHQVSTPTLFQHQGFFIREFTGMHFVGF